MKVYSNRHQTDGTKNMTNVRGCRHAIFLLALSAIALIGSSTENCLVGEEAKPLKVFVLAGQSNMQGHAHVRTIEAMRLNPNAGELLADMLDADGQPRRCEQVWISSIGSAEEEQTGQLTVGFGAKERGPKIGPEYTFGLYVEKMLDEPILIIKTAWGGKSLNTDFRPPNAGPYEFNEKQLETFRKQNKDIDAIEAEKKEATGRYYRLMTEHVKSVLADIKRVYPDYDPQQGYELAGFVWFQGWNDMVDSATYPNRDQPGGYDQYSTLMAQFIRDVRKDLAAPSLPFVIGVLGVGGPTSAYDESQRRYKPVHQNFRNAMAAPASLPEFKGNVATVLTEDYWDMEVVRLRAIETTIKPKVDAIKDAMKEKKVSRDEGQASIDKLYASTFSEAELTILQQSTSNQDFHYMGSAGIMAQIGKVFAESILELSK
jgi:hypothetical protein